MFNIKEFYSSIQEELLNKGLRFVQEHLDMASKDKEFIYHACKSLLFDEKDTQIKKQNGCFDVTMGAYDSAELCELVGTYRLSLISEKYNKNDFGLYCQKQWNGNKKKERKIYKKYLKKINQIQLFSAT